MALFKLVTDSTADLPADYYVKHNVGCMYLSVIMDGITYNKENPIDIKSFYEKLGGGSMPTTSQINPDEAKNELTEYLKENKNILYIAFSSGLSGSYQSGCIAAEEIMEENPDANIVVIDSLCASLGEGFLVNKAVQMMEEDKTIEETAAFIKENLLHVGHVFTVDDLFHLSRGGRISKGTAVVGSMINIKPLLHVNDEGKLINIGKCRGRKKALASLVELMDERLGDYRGMDQKCMISHSNCLEDAQYVARLVKEKFGYDTEIIDFIGPVIGTHTGIGTVALFFWADHR